MIVSCYVATAWVSAVWVTKEAWTDGNVYEYSRGIVWIESFVIVFSSAFFEHAI
jgi:hypothetical protein